MFRIPRHEIRQERKRRDWSQEKLASAMTDERNRAVQDEYPPFSFQTIGRLENGRGAIRFDDENEPLWWALQVLGIPASALFGSPPSYAAPTAPSSRLASSSRPPLALRQPASR